MLNEHNPRETSQKVRDFFQYKGGEDSQLPLATTPPYGYRKNPETERYAHVPTTAP
jgi:hypothetical protein